MAELRTRYDLAITEEDIDAGKVGDSYKCMVARAIAKKIPDAFGIKVDTQSVAFTIPHEDDAVRLTYLTPAVMQAYVISFDAGDELWPFRTRLQDPHVTARVKRGTAAVKAISESNKAKKKAIKEGATPEEAKAVSSAAYQEVKDAAFEKAHETHQELVAQGVENPVEKAAEEAGLLPAVPTPKSPHEDPLFAMTEKKAEKGTRRAFPRVLKSRKRYYGQRALRINWPIDPETGNRIKPEVTRLV